MQVPIAQPLLWQQVTTPQEQYVVSPQSVAPENYFQIPLMVKNGWVIQGIPQVQPRPTYVPQQVHYVAVHPGVPIDKGVVEKQSSIDSVEACSIQGPRRLNRGHSLNLGRCLRGNPFATRRSSDECMTETPVKKLSIEDKTEIKMDVNVKDRDKYILQNIEYYFSDENLSKNAYLLKQVLQENGYVSLKRVASLKRVKLYTRDEHVVAQCIRRSEKVELNEDGTMVRRKDPLPYNIETPRFVRSVIAINLPMPVPTIEAVTSLFASYGDLTHVGILKPGKKLPNYLTDYQAWIPDLGKKFCALVEFENQDEAQRACREINMKNRTNDSLRVALLKPGARLRRTLYRKYKGPDVIEESDLSSEKEERKLSTPINDHKEYDASCSGANSDSDMSSLPALSHSNTQEEIDYSHDYSSSSSSGSSPAKPSLRFSSSNKPQNSSVSNNCESLSGISKRSIVTGVNHAELLRNGSYVT